MPPNRSVSTESNLGRSTKLPATRERKIRIKMNGLKIPSAAAGESRLYGIRRVKADLDLANEIVVTTVAADSAVF